MSDIELVIKIPEKWFDDMVREKFIEVDELCVVIQHGTLLPKGHGDLKDNNILDTIFLNVTDSPNKKLSYEEISDLILDAPTIIEADREV